MSTKAKFILTYVGGIVTGIVLVFVFLFFVGLSQQGGRQILLAVMSCCLRNRNK